MNVTAALVKNQLFHHSGLVGFAAPGASLVERVRQGRPALSGTQGTSASSGTLLCSRPSHQLCDTPPSRSSNKRSRHPPTGQSVGTRHCVPGLPISTPFVPPLFSSPQQLARATLALLPHWSASLPRLLAATRTPRPKRALRCPAYHRFQDRGRSVPSHLRRQTVPSSVPQPARQILFRFVPNSPRELGDPS